MAYPDEDLADPAAEEGAPPPSYAAYEEPAAETGPQEYSDDDVAKLFAAPRADVAEPRQPREFSDDDVAKMLAGKKDTFSDDDVAKMLSGQPELESGVAGTIARGAAREVLPGVAGGLAGLALAGPGAAYGASIGAPAGPIGAGLGAIVGGVAGALIAGVPASMATRAVQDVALEKSGLREGTGFFSKAQEQADVEQHPYWKKVAELVGGAAPTFGTGGLRVLAGERGLGAALQTGMAGGQQLYQEGKLDWGDLALEAASGAVFAKPRGWAERMTPEIRLPGSRPAEKPAAEPPPPEDFANAPVDPDFAVTEPPAAVVPSVAPAAAAGSPTAEAPPVASAASTQSTPAVARPEPPAYREATPAEDAQITAALAQRDKADTPLAREYWDAYAENLRLKNASGKGDPGVPDEASQGPTASKGDVFSYRDGNAANDVTTVSSGVAHENHPVAVEGAGNPVGAPMEARTAARPSEPARNYGKDTVEPAPGVATQESTKVSQAPVHEDVAAALGGEPASSRASIERAGVTPTTEPAPRLPGAPPSPLLEGQLAQPSMAVRRANQEADQRTAAAQRSEPRLPAAEPLPGQTNVGRSTTPMRTPAAQAAIDASKARAAEATPAAVRPPAAQAAIDASKAKLPQHLRPVMTDEQVRQRYAAQRATAEPAPTPGAVRPATEGPREIGKPLDVEQKMIDTAIADMRAAGIDPAKVTGDPKWAAMSPREQAVAATKIVTQLRSKSGEATAAGGAKEKVRMPTPRATTKTGMVASSKGVAERRQGVADAYDRAYAENAKPAGRDETNAETVARAKQIAKRADELAEGKRYPARVKSPAMQVVAAAKRIGKTGVSAFRQTEFNATSGKYGDVVTGAETKPAAPAAAEPQSRLITAAEKYTPDEGARLEQETKRIEADIEKSRRHLPEAAAEARIAQAAEGQDTGRVPHEVPDNSKGIDSPAVHRQRASLVEMVNGLGDEDYAMLAARHEGTLDATLKAASDPYKVARSLVDEVAEIQAERQARDAKREAEKKAETLVERTPIKTAADVAKVESRKIEKGSPEWKRLAEAALAQTEGKPVLKRGSEEAKKAAAEATRKLDERIADEAAQQALKEVGHGDKETNLLRQLMRDEGGAISLPNFAFTMPNWMKRKPAPATPHGPVTAPVTSQPKLPPGQWSKALQNMLAGTKKRADAFFYPERGTPVEIFADEMGNHIFGKLQNARAFYDGKLQSNALEAAKKNLQPVEWQEIFRAVERRETGLLTGKLKDAYDTHIKHLVPEYGKVYDLNKKLAEDNKMPGHDQIVERKSNPGNGFNDFIPRLRKGKQNFDRADDLDPFIGGAQTITPKSDATELREFFDLKNTRTGERIVIVPGKGSFTRLHNGAPTKVNLPKSSSFDPSNIGDTINMKYKGVADDWIVDHSEANRIKLANGKNPDGSWKVEYHENPVLALSKRLSELHYDALKREAYGKIVNDPRFQAMRKTGLTNEEALKQGYVKTSLPGFEGSFLPKRVAWVMDDFARRGFRYDDITTQAFKDYSDRISSHFTKGIVGWAPLTQVFNIANDWAIGRGGRWFDPRDYKLFSATSRQAFKAVMEQDPAVIKQIIDAGGNLMYTQSVTRNFMPQIAKKFGIDRPLKDVSKWDPMAKLFKIKTVDMLDHAYDFVSNPIWKVSDMMAVQRYLEEKAAIPKTKAWQDGVKKLAAVTQELNWRRAAPPDPAREAHLAEQQHALEQLFTPDGLNRQAVQKMHEFVDSYRLPTTIGKHVLPERWARMAQKALSDPSLSMFAPYHMGRFHALGTIFRNGLKPDATYQERLHAAGQATMVGLTLGALYPALSAAYQWMTDNENARFDPRGSSRVVDIAGKVLTGEKDLSAITTGVLYTPAVPLNMGIELLKNRDWRGKEIIQRRDLTGDPFGALPQLGEYVAGNLPVVGPAYQSIARGWRDPSDSPLETTGNIAKKVAEQLIVGGVSTPSQAAVKYELQGPKLRQREIQQREKKPPGPIEYYGNEMLRAITGGYAEGGLVTATATRPKGVIPTSRG